MLSSQPSNTLLLKALELLKEIAEAQAHILIRAGTITKTYTHLSSPSYSPLGLREALRPILVSTDPQTLQAGNALYDFLI